MPTTTTKKTAKKTTKRAAPAPSGVDTMLVALAPALASMATDLAAITAIHAKYYGPNPGGASVRLTLDACDLRVEAASAGADKAKVLRTQADSMERAAKTLGDSDAFSTSNKVLEALEALGDRIDDLEDKKTGANGSGKVVHRADA